MAVQLADYVEVLRREISPPVDSPFEDIDEDTLIGYMADGFWQARLENVGDLDPWTVSDEGLVEPIQAGGADMSRDKIALIVVYAGIRMLRNHLMNLTTRFAARAGSVEFEQERSANLLTALLEDLKSLKTAIVEQVEEVGTTAFLIDGVTVRSLCPDSYYGTLSIWGGW